MASVVVPATNFGEKDNGINFASEDHPCRMQAVVPQRAMRRPFVAGGLAFGRPLSTPLCLFRRETGLARCSYRAVCLAVRSVCGGRGRRRLRRGLARADVADAEYGLERLFLHVPARRSVQVAPAFGPLDHPSVFETFFSELHRKDDRSTTLVERPHPYDACRPLAFSLHWQYSFTDLEEIDIERRRVNRRVSVLGPGELGTPFRGRQPAVKYIHHDLERNELVMTSVQTEQALSSVILFSLQPLQFLLHFQVLRRHFPHADSVTVGEGVVMLASRSRGCVTVFSLDRLLKERKFEAHLGDEVVVDGRRYVVGQHPHGLPVNGELLPLTPSIATFPAYHGYLELGATPYHLVTMRKRREGFQVHCVRDGSRVLTCPSLRSGVTPEAATFLDDTPFLVQHSISELRVFDLKSGQMVLRVDPMCYSGIPSPQPNAVVTTRSGRSVRRRSRPDSLSQLSGSDWWLAWDLEDELDLLAVVVVEEEVGEAAVLRRLLLFDRLTWTMTSDTALDHRLPLAGAGLAQMALVMDRCLLFIKLRTTTSKCVALTYTLVPGGGDDDEQRQEESPPEGSACRARAGRVSSR